MKIIFEKFLKRQRAVNLGRQEDENPANPAKTI